MISITHPWPVCETVRNVDPPQPGVGLVPEAVSGREEVGGGEESAGTVVDS